MNDLHSPGIGDIAPDFEALTDTGDGVKLSDYRGQRVVLYFYPKDDTSGCTKQCTPQCQNRKCGPDPTCGTSCGSCDAQSSCNADGQCVDGGSVPCGAYVCADATSCRDSSR